MQELFKQFVRIATLRAGPQDLPSHSLALQLAIAFAVTTDTAVMLGRMTLVGALVASIVSTVLSAVLVYGVLHWRGRSSRFGQTFCAWCGALGIVSMVGIPVISAFPELSSERPSTAAVMLWQLLSIWTVIVGAWILHHALEISMWQSSAITFLMMLVMILAFATITSTL